MWSLRIGKVSRGSAFLNGLLLQTHVPVSKVHRRGEQALINAALGSSAARESRTPSNCWLQGTRNIGAEAAGQVIQAAGDSYRCTALGEARSRSTAAARFCCLCCDRNATNAVRLSLPCFSLPWFLSASCRAMRCQYTVRPAFLTDPAPLPKQASMQHDHSLPCVSEEHPHRRLCRPFQEVSARCAAQSGARGHQEQAPALVRLSRSSELRFGSPGSLLSIGAQQPRSSQRRPHPSFSPATLATADCPSSANPAPPPPSPCAAPLGTQV
jgi:hypothetical protein